ncbi:MAG: phosphoheptose isomerase [Burkholderiales bacterium]|nr:phosphoheptose isomerase [Burkholderiales bacterium]MBX3714649.1 phosphoheptose isomerase [Burkholderiales bacterium]MCL4689612.1 phosphoheptose isomerase [Burkholderiales bacterium]
MDHTAHVRRHFQDAIELKTRMSETLAPAIARAGEALAAALARGNKVLACGNGGSAADCQHFAAELVGRFERERPGLPAVALTVDTSALTAIANDYSYDEVFSKQVEALGREGDALLALSTSGNSRNVIAAMKAARARGMAVVALTGRDGGEMARLLGPGDHHLNVAHPRTMRIQEVHILALHCLCDTIDNVLHGEK